MLQIELIRKRHPGVAAEIITALDQGHSSPSITTVRDSKEWLEAAGFEMPSWEALAQGAGPNRPNPEAASSNVARGGPMVAEPFSSVPTSGETRFLLLLRRSVFLLLTICPFRCGCLLDVIGHRHSWEAWVCIGVSRRKGVRTNVFVRELDHHPGQNRFDVRRWEVVVDGLEFFNVAKLAVDTTLVSVLRADGTGSRKGVTVGGEALRKSQGTEGENSFRTRWSPLKVAVHISVVTKEKSLS